MFFLRLFHLLALLSGIVLIVICPIFFPGFLVFAIFSVLVSFLLSSVSNCLDGDLEL